MCDLLMLAGAYKTNYSVHAREVNGTARELNGERTPEQSINPVKLKISKKHY